MKKKAVKPTKKKAVKKKVTKRTRRKKPRSDLTLKVQNISLKKINAAPYNPRKDLQPGEPEYESIRRSLKTWSLVEPLVWNKRTGNLVGGHQRLKILREDTHLKSAPCSIVDLPLAEEKALNAALNKIAGAWDEAKLAKVLRGLSRGKVDATLTGFTSKEMTALLGDPKAQVDGDSNPSAEEAWRGMPGFTSEDQMGVKRLIVHFATLEDMQSFAKLVNQPINEKTTFIWYPKAVREVTSHLRIVSGRKEPKS